MHVEHHGAGAGGGGEFPAVCQLHVFVNAMTRLPSIICASANATVALSPNLWPIAAPGNESATPGMK
jgi:hypothetical protein